MIHKGISIVDISRKAGELWKTVDSETKSVSDRFLNSNLYADSFFSSYIANKTSSLLLVLFLLPHPY